VKNAVLFDLDGTLLPLDIDEFFKRYLGVLSRRFAPTWRGELRDLVKLIERRFGDESQG